MLWLTSWKAICALSKGLKGSMMVTSMSPSDMWAWGAM